MGENPISTLQERYLREMAEGEKRLSDLRIKLRALEELVAEQGGSIETVSIASKSSVGDKMPEKLTAACVWIIGKYAAGAPIGTGRVKELLTQHRFDTTGKNFNIILMKTLKRLIESDRIDGVKGGGNWGFFPKVISS